MMSTTTADANNSSLPIVTEHEKVIESRIHAFRNAAHTLVFAVCEGNDVAHALSSAREQLVQLKLAMSASEQLRNVDDDGAGRCDVCGWATRLDVVQLQIESISNQSQSNTMALDEQSNHHHQQQHRHLQCQCNRRQSDKDNENLQ